MSGSLIIDTPQTESISFPHKTIERLATPEMPNTLFGGYAVLPYILFFMENQYDSAQSSGGIGEKKAHNVEQERITLRGIAVIKFKVKVMLAIRETTQKELAQRTGIRPPTLSAICTGSVRHLPVETLNKLCAALECQPSDLMVYVPDGEEGV